MNNSLRGKFGRISTIPTPKEETNETTFEKMIKLQSYLKEEQAQKEICKEKKNN